MFRCPGSTTTTTRWVFPDHVITYLHGETAVAKSLLRRQLLQQRRNLGVPRLLGHLLGCAAPPVEGMRIDARVLHNSYAQ